MSARPARRGPLIAGLACCLIYAALASTSGADRLGWPMLPFAAMPMRTQHAAARAVVGGAGNAAALAAQAVRTDPLNMHTLGLLGTAALLENDPVLAKRVFAHGARLGWRDLPTRSFAFGQAAQAGHWEGAARHFEAVARAYPDLAATRAMAAQMESAPAGQRALTGMLRRHPDWTARYLAGPDARVADLVIRAAWLSNKQSGVLGCAPVRPLADRLLQRGLRRAAGRVWQAHCDPRPLPLIADAAFAGLAAGGGKDPFGWQVHPAGDVTLTIGSAGRGGQALIARTSATSPRLLLTQPVAWQPGSYKADGNGLGRDGRFLLSLDCGRAARRPQASLTSERGQTVTAGDCEQTLGIWIMPSAGEARLSGLSIEAL